MSGRAQKGLFDHRLDLAVFGWKGVNNGDSWIQPSVVWRFLEVLSAEVRADFVWGTRETRGCWGTSTASTGCWGSCACGCDRTVACRGAWGLARSGCLAIAAHRGRQ